MVTTITKGISLTTSIRAGVHAMIADEPKDYGGGDLGPSPYDYLIAALGSCTGMTLSMYARRKGWYLSEIKVNLKHEKVYAADCEDFEKPGSKIDMISRKIELRGELDDKQRKRLMEIADKCPVHKSLSREIRIQSTLKPPKHEHAERD